MEDITATEFIDLIKSEKNTHRGKLALWKEDIITLREAGLTYADIVRYLELKKVSASISGVQAFYTKVTGGNVDKKSSLNNEPIDGNDNAKEHKLESKPSEDKLENNAEPGDASEKKDSAFGASWDRELPSWNTTKYKKYRDLI